MARKTSQPVIMRQLGRRLVQLCFLMLFLFPLIVIIYQKVSFIAAPTFTSWLLVWDPAVLVAQVLIVGCQTWLSAHLYSFWHYLSFLAGFFVDGFAQWGPCRTSCIR